MANSIKLRRSAVAGKQPADLALGEVAINTADGVFYFAVLQNGVKYLYRIAGEQVGLMFADTIDAGGFQPPTSINDFDSIASPATRTVDFGTLY